MSHRIIVDVMGADNGSGVVIRGAVAGARRAGASLLLVGSRAVIENELADVKTKGLDIQIEHADTVVQMDDQPGVVMKEKSDSSMALAVRLLKEGRGDALISCGNTGAVRRIWTSASSTTSSSGRCGTGSRWRRRGGAAIPTIPAPPAGGW